MAVSIILQVAAVIGCLLALVLVMAAVDVIAAMRRNPDLHVWPSLTRCRLCEKRVFAWQRHEFRKYFVVYDNPNGLSDDELPRMEASGIVHRKCHGTPVITLKVLF